MQPYYTSVVPLGNTIFLRWVEDGKRHMRRVDYTPKIYARANGKGCGMKSLHGHDLDVIPMESMKDARDYVQRYKDVDGYKLYGTLQFDASFIAEYFPHKIEFDMAHIRVGNIDIEVFSGSINDDGSIQEGPFPEPKDALYPITAITFHDSFTDTYYVYGLETFMGKKLGTFVYDKNCPRIGHLNIEYKGFQTEESLLKAFLGKWADMKFDVYTGFNTTTFDTPYLTNRIKKLLGDGAEKQLSPWKLVNMRTFQNMYGDQLSCEWYGMEELDWLDLYKKFSFESPINYKLGTLGTNIVGETKISYEEAGTLTKLYITDYQKYIVYNVKDVDLVNRLDKERGYIHLAMSIAYMTKSNYRDALATVKPWSNLIYDMLNKKGIVPDMPRIFQGDIELMGGYVKQPKPGLYRWVVSLDLNSLYPHIMKLLNLGPETLVDRKDLPQEIKDLFPTSIDPDYVLDGKIRTDILQKYDLAVSAKGHFFKRDKKSIFHEKVEEIYSMRASVKKGMKKKEQLIEDIKVELKKRGVEV